MGSYATGGLLESKKKRGLVNLSGVSKSYREDLFNSVDLTVEGGDRIGLVGANGCGKTTLLRVITGQVDPDSGNVSRADGASIAEVSQIPELEEKGTLLEAVTKGGPEVDQLRSQMEVALKGLSDPGIGPGEVDRLTEEYSELDNRYRLSGGYDAENRAAMILAGLGLGRDKLSQPVATLSGGEKTRAMIARALMAEPDLLLLDEPTNHLDIECMEWLEGFLRTINSAYIIISHDRFFLDATIDTTVELENGRTVCYPGNYTKYKELKELGFARHVKEYTLQQGKIKREEELIRFLKTLGVKKRRQAKSREKLLAKVERIDRPFRERHIRMLFKPEFRGAAEVLRADGLKKRLGGRTLMEGLTFTLKRDDKLGLIGPNGSGKTTLIGMLAGTVEPDSGEVELGSFTFPAYYDQELASLDMDNTVLEEASMADPHGRAGSVRALLATFLFRSQEMGKRVAKLSGGEKGRLALAKLVLCGSNLLLLDEPTNHLDLRSREVLEEALKTYQGTLVMASHDRRLVSSVCNRLIVFSGTGATVRDCDYETYSRRR
jgi:ATP-binding cassette subfamily F protein 3